MSYARGKRDGEKGGNVPLGYTRDEQGVIVDPISAALVRRMFLMRGQSRSLGDIAATLNTEGVPAPHGGQSWHPSTVREVLMHERSYRGGKRDSLAPRLPIILDSVVPDSRPINESGVAQARPARAFSSSHIADIHMR